METCRRKHLVLCGHFYCSYAIVERLCWNAASFGQRKERGTELFQRWSHFPACLPTMFKIPFLWFFYLPGETDSFHGVASQMGYVQRRTMSNRGRKKRRGAWHRQFRLIFGRKFCEKSSPWTSGFLYWICWIFLLEGGVQWRSGSSWITVIFNLWGDDYTDSFFEWCSYLLRRFGLV